MLIIKFVNHLYFSETYLGFNQVYHLVKGQPDYQALPRKVSQQVSEDFRQKLAVIFQGK